MWKNKTLILVITTVLVLSSIILVSNEIDSNPGIIYVDDDGTADYTSIQEAIDNAPDGETIYVFSGIYYENIVTNKQKLTLIGENKNTTIIDAKGTGDGIRIGYDSTSISDFTIRNTGGDGFGIVIYHRWHINISRCIIYNCSGPGISFYSDGRNAHTDYNSVIDCEIYANQKSGICFYSHKPSYDCWTNHNKIINTKIYSNHRYGIEFSGDTGGKRYNTISNCECYNNSLGGIKPTGSGITDNQFLDILCYENGGDGIFLKGQNNILSNCTCYENSGTGINNEENNPLIMDSTAYGNEWYGCRISNSVSFDVINSIFYDNHDGILIDGSSNGKVINCSTYDNSWSGIVIDSSNGAEIDNCLSHDNYDGIFVLDGAYNNTIHGCTIVNNNNYGMRILSSNNNLFYNNYLNNIHNGYDPSSNKWNISKTIGTNIIGGSYMGGNYWSGYIGIDLEGDGLGENPYTIPGDSNQDRHPLMYPYNPPIHTIVEFQAIEPMYTTESIEISISINPGEPIAGAQVDMSFDPSMLSIEWVAEGNIFSEYDTYFDQGVIDNINGTLKNLVSLITTPGGSTTDEGSIAVISIRAKTIPGETPLNLSNVIVGDPEGTPIDVTIINTTVTINYHDRWDVNWDDRVNILDLILIGQWWGEMGTPCWVSADVNCDGVVNILDMILVGQHWGKYTPPEPINHQVGLWSKPWGNYCDYSIKEFLGNIFTIKDYNETKVIYSVSHPSSDDDWTIVKKDISVNYNQPQGIYCVGDSPNRFQTVYPEPINLKKYTLEMKCGFHNRWAEIGLCFNYSDENNYSVVSLYYDRDVHKYICYRKIEGGIVTVKNEPHYPTQPNTDYILKVKIDHEHNKCDVYVNGILELKVNV